MISPFQMAAAILFVNSAMLIVFPVICTLDRGPRNLRFYSLDYNGRVLSALTGIYCIFVYIYIYMACLS